MPSTLRHSQILLELRKGSWGMMISRTRFTLSLLQAIQNDEESDACHSSLRTVITWLAFDNKTKQVADKSR